MTTDCYEKCTCYGCKHCDKELRQSPCQGCCVYEGDVVLDNHDGVCKKKKG